MYKQIVLRVEYSLNHPVAGLSFVGCDPGDNVCPQGVGLMTEIPACVYHERWLDWSDRFLATVCGRDMGEMSLANRDYGAETRAGYIFYWKSRSKGDEE
jgi:hypothetical protein